MADGGAETGAEVAVDEWVDGAVGRSEPLSDRQDVHLERRPLAGRHLVGRREQEAQSDGVQRQPRQTESHKHDYQHAQDLRLRPCDVSLSSRTLN